MKIYYEAFILSFILSLLITPIVRIIAINIKAIDIPDKKRKIHKKPMPTMGGLAIFISFIFTTFIFYKYINLNIRALIIGCSIIVFCGIIDDIISLSYKQKLFFQFIATTVLIYHNVSIKHLSISFFSNNHFVSLGYIGVLITFLWIIGITNALNLIDGLDGLACGLSFISFLFLFIIAYINCNIPIAILIIIMAGASLGFLPYNFNPAKIFLGDTGSLFLGFFLATISIQGTMKSATTIILILPILIIGIPIYDTLSIIIRRKFEGKSIMSPDKEHLHHRLLQIGLSHRQVVLVCYLVNIILSTCAVSTIFYPEYQVIVLLTIFILLLIAVIWENIVYNSKKQEI